MELHLSLNSYHSVDTSHCLPHLSLLQLFFNENNITHWEHMSNIGQIFPNLEQLVIIANPIASLGPKEKAGENLAKLKAINLQETQIKSWEEVEKLRGIPALTDIRLRRTPVLQVLIAVICNIRTPGIWDGPLFIRGGGTLSLFCSLLCQYRYSSV